MSVIVKVLLSHEILESPKFFNFKTEVERLIESGGKILMLDFSNINFLKNSELMAVVAIVKLVRDSNCILLISSMSEQVRMLFELTGLAQIFQCLPSADDVDVAVKNEIKQPLSRLQNVALKSEVNQPLGGLQNVAS